MTSPRLVAFPLIHLAYRAKSSPTTARWVIVGLHVALGCTMAFAGWLLADLEAAPDAGWLSIPVSLGLVAIFFYPSRINVGTWMRRKVHDATMLLAAMSIWLFAGMQLYHGTLGEQFQFGPMGSVTSLFAARAPESSQLPDQGKIQMPLQSAADAAMDVSTMTSIAGTPVQPGIVNGQLLKDDGALAPASHSGRPQAPSQGDISEHVHAKPTLSVGVKVLLFTLAILVALGLAYLIAIVACSIICSGVPVLGYAVLVVGWAGLIVGLILIGRALFRKRVGSPAPSRAKA